LDHSWRGREPEAVARGRRKGYKSQRPLLRYGEKEGDKSLRLPSGKIRHQAKLDTQKFTNFVDDIYRWQSVTYEITQG